jgi:hypothetical protein
MAAAEHAAGAKGKRSGKIASEAERGADSWGQKEEASFGVDKKCRKNPGCKGIVAPNPMRRTEGGQRSAFCERAILREGPRSAPERQGELARTGSVHVGWRPGRHAVLGQESGDRGLRERSLDPAHRPAATGARVEIGAENVSMIGASLQPSNYAARGGLTLLVLP